MPSSAKTGTPQANQQRSKRLRRGVTDSALLQAHCLEYLTALVRMYAVCKEAVVLPVQCVGVDVEREHVPLYVHIQARKAVFDQKRGKT